jgi:hypothetical protein
MVAAKVELRQIMLFTTVLIDTLHSTLIQRKPFDPIRMDASPGLAIGIAIFFAAMIATP